MQLAVAINVESDSDPIYRFLNEQQQPCVGDECL